MIFLSHNYNDKPIVEQVALKLRAAYGQENVFYDSWSIQPGEGIVDRMSQALGACTHFFFFVSENSLKSKMVSLEWQNAMIKATKGQTKLVPVRCDKAELPPIMAQSLYIDLFTYGLEAACAQISDVIVGANTYREPTRPFKNLACIITKGEDSIQVEIQAKYFLEPIARFLMTSNNAEGDLTIASPEGEGFHLSGFNADLQMDNGVKINGWYVGITRGLTPSMPLRFKVLPRNGAAVVIAGVLHQTTHERWEPIPIERIPAARFPSFGIGSHSA